MLAVIAIPVLLGSASPKERVDTSELLVRDKNGIVRIHLWVDDQGDAHVALRDAERKMETSLRAGDQSASLTIGDSDGSGTVNLTAGRSTALLVANVNGNPRTLIAPPRPIDHASFNTP